MTLQKMDLFGLLITLLSIYQINVEAVEDPNCPGLPALEMTPAIQALTEKIWWYYMVVDKFVAPDIGLPFKEDNIPINFEFDGISVMKSIAPAAGTLKLLLHDEGFVYITMITFTLKQIGSNAIYKTKLNKVRLVYTNGTPTEHLADASQFSPSSDTPYALLFASEDYLIYRSCDKQGAVVLLSKDIVNEGAGDNYDDRIRQQLRSLGIPTNNVQKLGLKTYRFSSLPSR